MTSAHRPTFDHAKGKEKRVVSSITHKRALTTHSKLKFRNKKACKNKEFFETDTAENEDEITNQGRRIDGLNEEHILQLRKCLVDGKDAIKIDSTEIGYNELLKDTTTNKNNSEDSKTDDQLIEEIKLENKYENKTENKIENANENEENEEDGSDEGEDDTDSGDESDSDDDEALLKEIELIRKEREDAKKNIKEEKISERAKTSNPLLHFVENKTNEDNKPKKKSWRSAKTMSKKVESNEIDRFSNDTLKTDFHKDFLDRYIK